MVCGMARTAGPSTSLRYGRDDNSVETGIDATEQSWTPQQNCHRPDRKWRDRSVVEGPAVSPAAIRLSSSSKNLIWTRLAESSPGHQSWADCEFSRRVVSPLAIPGLASWDILSRPWRDCSRMSSLPRTGVLAYSQPSLRDSVCKSSSHAGSLAPASLARSRISPH